MALGLFLEDTPWIQHNPNPSLRISVLSRLQSVVGCIYKSIAYESSAMNLPFASETPQNLLRCQNNYMAVKVELELM